MRTLSKRLSIFVVLFIMGIINFSSTHADSVSVSDEAGLAQAIIDANASPELDIIELTADINLTTNDYYDSLIWSGTPLITSPIVIKGNGFIVRRTGTFNYSLFSARSTILTLENITLANGYNTNGGAVYIDGGDDATLNLFNVTVGGSPSDANQASQKGGGVYADSNVFIYDSLFSHNSLNADSGNRNYGGGLYTGSRDTGVVIVNTIFDSNHIENRNLSFQDRATGGAGSFFGGGEVFIFNSTFTNNTIAGNKMCGIGALYEGRGEFSVHNSHFENNSNPFSAENYASGGGLCVEAEHNGTVDLIIENSYFLNNNLLSDTYTSGAGLDVIIDGVVTINDSAFTENSMTAARSFNGGGAEISADDIRIHNSLFADNEMTRTDIGYSSFYVEGGGGLKLVADNVLLENSTITNNRVIVLIKFQGGEDIANGGGINARGNIIFRNLLIADNTLALPEGNPEDYDAGWYLHGINSSTDSILSVENSIITNNIVEIDSVEAIQNCSDDNVSNGYNMIEPNGNCTSIAIASDILATTTLSPLADNGGFTETRAITTTPPINSGNPATCPVTDQRGAPRDAQCDIGPYEAGTTVPVAISPVANNDSFAMYTVSNLVANLQHNDVSPNGEELVSFIVTAPSNGSLNQFDIAGLFTYVPSNNFSGTDIFTYISCTLADGHCSSPATVTISVNDTSSVPESPSDVTSSAVTWNSIDLTWVDNADDETDYFVERRDAINNSWILLANLPANTTTYTDEALRCDYDYDYRVIAYRNSDTSYSIPSMTLTVSTATCPAPANLQAQPVDFQTVDITWTNVLTDQTNYYVRVRDENGILQPTTLLSTNPTAFQVTELNCETLYRFQVYSERRDYFYPALNTTSEIAEVTATTLTCPPPPIAPSNLTTASIAGFTIDLVWDDNSTDEERFFIEFSSDNGVTWQELNYLRANTITQTVANLSCETEYQFRIRAWRRYMGIYSDYSNILTEVTDTCPPPPLAPTDISISVGAAGSYDYASILWSDNATDETDYQIERSEDGGATWNHIRTTSSNAISYSDNFLDCGIVYTYRVLAYRSGDNTFSEPSELISISALCEPTLVTVTATAPEELTITWLDNSDDETGFYVRRQHGSWSTIATLPANTTSYVDADVECGVNYRYSITAYRDIPDHTAASASSAYQSTLPCPPNAPDNLLLVQNGLSSVDLAWADNTNDETAYVVERSDDSGATWVEITSLTPDTTSYSDTSLSCETEYSYRLRAYDNVSDQYSDYSNSETIAYRCNPPANPSGLSVTNSDFRSISLQWTDNAQFETAYRIERSEDTGVNWVELAPLAANTTTYNDTSLTCATDFNYRVRAYDAITRLYSGYSNISMASTNACQILDAPSNLLTTNTGAFQIELSWTDNATFETSLLIERSDDNGATWQQTTQLAANTSNYNDTGLDCQTTYQYRVRAYDSINDIYSDYSNSISAATNSCDTGICTLSEFNSGFSSVPGDTSTYTFFNAYLSGNGNRLALHRGFPPQDLLIYDVATETLLAEIVSAVAHDIDADGSHVVFNSSTDLIGQNADLNTEMFLWNNGIITQLTNTIGTGYDYSRAQISDDGSIIVFVGRASIIGDNDLGNSYYRWDSTNGIQKLIPDTFSGSIPSPIMTISGDASTIVYVAGNDIYLWTQANGSQLMTTLIDSTAQNLTLEPDSLHVNTDGSRVIFTAQNDFVGQNADHTREIYLWVEGLGLQQLTDSTLDATWSIGLDGVGGRILVSDIGDITGQNPDENGEYFFFEERIGYQQVSDTDYLGTTTIGNSISIDGTRIAIIMPDRDIDQAQAESDPIQNLYPYLRLFIGDCSSPAPLPDYLSPPTDLSADPSSDTEINLSWTDNSLLETNFLIERSTDGIAWVEIAQTAANVTAYIDSSITCGTEYRYRVRAYNGNGNQISFYSDIVTYSSPDCPAEPFAPSNLVATANSTNSVSLTWQDNSQIESSYFVHVSANQGVNWSSLGSLPANSESFTHVNTTGVLECEKEVIYRVGLGSPSGNSDYSNEVTVVLPECDGPLQEPVPPSNIVITDISTTQVSISWHNQSYINTGFHIEFREADDINWLSLVSYIRPDSTTSYDIATTQEFLCGGSYYIRMKSYQVGSLGEGVPSDEIAVNFPACTELESISNFSRSMSTNMIYLNWGRLSRSHYTYYLERSSDDGITWVNIESPELQNTRYDDTDLPCNMEYQYRVYAVNYRYGTITPYASQTVSTLPCHLDAPTISDFTQVWELWTSNRLAVTANNIPYPQTYVFEYERSLDGGNTWQSISSPDTNYVCGINNLYRARLIDEVNNLISPYSAPIVINKECNTPTALTAVDTLNGINLNWTDNSSTETDYFVRRSTDGVNWGGVYDFLDEDVESYQDSNAECGQTYYYYVQAARHIGVSNYETSDPSNIASATPDCTDQLGPIFSVNSTVLVGDTGCTDRHCTFMEAFDAANSYFASAPSIILPAGNHIVQNLPDLANPNINIIGAGMNSTVLQADGAELFILPPFLTMDNFVISDLTISDPHLVIEARGNINLQMTNVMITGTVGETIYRGRGSSYSSLLFDNLQINGVSSTSHIPLFDLAGTQMTMTNSLIANSQIRNFMTVQAVSNATYQISNTTISGNTFATGDPQSYAIEIGGDSESILFFEHVTVANNSNFGFDISGNASSELFFNNSIFADNNYQGTPNDCEMDISGPAEVVVIFDDTIVEHNNCPAITYNGDPGEPPISLDPQLEALADNGGNTLTHSLAPTSPAIDAIAIESCQLQTDQRGTLRPYGDACDIGAFESDVINTIVAPNNLVTTAIGSTQIDLAWNDNSTQESNYHLERSVNGVDWDSIILAANSTSYSDTGLVCSSDYQYRLRAYQATGDIYSNYTTILPVSTQLCPAPIAVSSFMANAVQDGITLSWVNQAVDYDELLLEKSIDGIAWSSLATLPAHQTSHLDTAIACNQNYRYRITVSRTRDGQTATSSEISVLMPLCSPPNDDFASASTIISLPYSDIQQHGGATNEITDPMPLCSDNNNNSVWYQFTPSENGNYSFTTQGSQFDVTLSVWTWTGTFNPFACDKDSALDGQAVISSTLQSGTTYYIMLSGNNDVSANATLNVSQLADPSPTPVPTIVPPPTAIPPAVENTVALFSPSTNTWQFRNANNSGDMDMTFTFGTGTNNQALIGDWDGDNTDGIGLYRDGVFVFRNLSEAGSIDSVSNFGPVEAGWQAIAGDWNGDNTDSIGIYKDGQFMLSDDNGTLHYIFNFGPIETGWIPVAGDWDGDGFDSVGLYKNGIWLLSTNSSNPNIYGQIAYGPSNNPDWKPVVGDWNADNMTTIGLYGSGLWRVRHIDSFNTTEIAINFGTAGDWIPLSSYRGTAVNLNALGAAPMTTIIEPLPTTPVPTDAAPIPEATELVIEENIEEPLEPEITVSPSDVTITPEPELTPAPEVTEEAEQDT